ncbi:MAG: DUF1800 family protein [Bryobacteraceae bacterium]
MSSRVQRCGYVYAAAFLMMNIAPLRAAVTVSISPSSYTLRVGATKTFSASVSGATNRTVTWAVNGVVGGNATVGTISTGGLYTTPAVVPAANVVKVRATSVADGTVFAESTLTLQNPEPGITSVTPNMVNIGTFTVVLAGRGFVRGSVAKIGDVPVPTTYVSATELRVTATDNTPRDTTMAVSNPEPGAVQTSGKYFKIMPTVTVNVYPDTYTMRIGTTKQMSVSVGNAVDKSVTWTVNGVVGGNATFGTISDTGLYTPPAALPATPQVSVKATSKTNTAISDTSTISLQNPVPVVTRVLPGVLVPGTQPAFRVELSGLASGATLWVGSTQATILQIMPTFVTATVKIPYGLGGIVTVSVRNPDPGAVSSNALIVPVQVPNAQMTPSAAARFLQRASWGPSPESIADLQTKGITTWLNEQRNAPISDLPEPLVDSSSITPAQRAFYLNAMTGRDQLRQRMGFALSQILVVSGVKTGSSQQLVPYMRLMNQHAFGNYFTLLKEVTLSPTMGRFLDMVNNVKANPARGLEPNENYGRELLQLFTLGLNLLNMDGTNKLDSFGKPIPTYTEDNVKHFARALTGWTYPTKPGATPKAINPSYYVGQMIATDENHDKTQKTLLNGYVIPAGRTAPEELENVIENIRQHPNVPPFVALRLIQRLVMGQPSPAYVQRVATRFQQTGGDLWETAKAIVTDPEADAITASTGKLREPVLFILSYLRGLDADVLAEHGLNSYANNMGQNLWNAPSVFNYFSPFYRANGVVAPEYQINTPSVALNRVNFIYRASRNGLGSTVAIDLAELERLAADPPALLEALNQALMHGAMSAAMKTSILTALNATTDVRTRARNAAYLVGSSSQYQVEP